MRREVVERVVIFTPQLTWAWEDDRSSGFDEPDGLLQNHRCRGLRWVGRWDKGREKCELYYLSTEYMAVQHERNFDAFEVDETQCSGPENGKTPKPRPIRTLMIVYLYLLSNEKAPNKFSVTSF